jgi:hypothetical protein
MSRSRILQMDEQGQIRILDPEKFDAADKLRTTGKTFQQG